MRDMVLVLNYDNETSRTITRKLRSERVLCKIVPGTISLDEVERQSPMGLVLAAGADVPEAAADERLFVCGLPVLALGGAAGLLLQALGGKMGGTAMNGGLCTLQYRHPVLFRDMEDGDRMMPPVQKMELPGNVNLICSCDGHPVGFAHSQKPLFGFQLKAEQSDMEISLMLRNFALDLCGCTTWWDDDAFVTRAMEEIRRITQDGTAVCAMTGGLDSGVSALLGFRALGKNLKCIFVDTGLLRKNEVTSFLKFYQEQLGMDILCIRAKERFLQALQGIQDPVEKRRAIGLTMQQVLNEEKHRLGAYQALIAGTSYNDIMFGKGDKRPVLSEDVPLMEPVRELFKDEIRRIGDYLGIPQDLLSRQPFPGSGLALRIMGEVTEDRLHTLRAADHIFREEIALNHAEKKLWQYFAVLSPLPGAEESHVICLRAVQTGDQNMAYAARLPYDVVESTTKRILETLPHVKRVVYDLTPSNNYAGIEWQ